MSMQSNIAAMSCDWYAVVSAMRRQCRAFTVQSISPLCEVSASWLDEHGVELRWSTGRIHRNLQITLEGDAWPLDVRFSGSAWVEPPRGPQDFKWWSAPKVQTAETTDYLESVIAEWLPRAHREIEGLAANC
ncbi:MAG: hypothetical protein SFV51_12850 [Bryobacteraceae bacterium]|nr:hypothetical protein [Bryobacteraceae bacterium]